MNIFRQRSLLIGSGVAYIASQYLLGSGHDNTSVLAILLSYVLLYGEVDKTDLLAWHSNPIRVIMPIFVIFQSLYWMRCLTIEHNILSLGQNFFPAMYYPLERVPSACAQYLGMYYIYFAGLSMGYNFNRRKANIMSRSKFLDQKRILLFGVPSVILTAIIFASTYNLGMKIPLFVWYIIESLSRLDPLFCGLITIIVFFPESKWIRTVVLIAFLISFAFRIQSAQITQMRFMVLEPVALIGVTFLLIKRVSLRQLGVALGVIFLILFILLPSLNEIKYTNMVFTPESLSMHMLQGLDLFVMRAASYHTNAAIEELPVLENLFILYRDSIVHDLIDGLPFSRIFLKGRPDEISFAMRFAQTQSGYPIESSEFVSAFTALKYSWGSWVAFVGAILFGLGHGLIASRIAYWHVAYAWLIPSLAFTTVALHGMRTSDMLKIPVNMMIFLVVLAILQKKGQSGHNLRPKAL
jgi:hypothetical protein